MTILTTRNVTTGEIVATFGQIEVVAKYDVTKTDFENHVAAAKMIAEQMVEHVRKYTGGHEHTPTTWNAVQLDENKMAFTNMPQFGFTV